MKTLVTKLNGTVDNIYLPKIGYFPIKINSAVKGKASFFVSLSAKDENKTLVYLPNDGSYITNKEGTDNLGTEVKSTSSMYDTFYLSNNTNIAFINKYILTRIDVASVDTIIDFEDLRYSPVISLQGKFSGNLSVLPNSILNKLEILNIAPNSFVEDFDISLFQNNQVLVKLMVDSINVSGDLSKISKTCCEFSARKSKPQITYTGTRPSDSKCMAIYGNLKLGNYVDAFLIDNAKFAKGNKPTYTFNVIEITGTRTSASDEAVSKLQEFGLTVSVHPM